MNVLLDTNILTRMAQPGTAHYQIALDAVNTTHGWLPPW